MMAQTRIKNVMLQKHNTPFTDMISKYAPHFKYNYQQNSWLVHIQKKYPKHNEVTKFSQLRTFRFESGKCAHACVHAYVYVCVCTCVCVCVCVCVFSSSMYTQSKLDKFKCLKTPKTYPKLKKSEVPGKFKSIVIQLWNWTYLKASTFYVV